MRDDVDECTLLVMGCDEYADVMKINGYFMARYMSDLKINKVCCVQTKMTDSTGFDDIIYTSESDLWTTRLHKALKQIESQYIILIQDDFYFTRKISDNEINKYVDYMKNNNIGELKLLSSKKRLASGTESSLHELGKDDPFRVSFTVAIWNRDFLSHVTPTECSVWEAERLGAIESRKYDYRVLETPSNIWGMVHAVMGGYWTKKAYNLFQKEEVERSFYSKRKRKPLYKYWKDWVFVLVTTIAPKTSTKIIARAKNRRK